jgi:hypothetical protein
LKDTEWLPDQVLMLMLKETSQTKKNLVDHKKCWPGRSLERGSCLAPSMGQVLKYHRYLCLRHLSWLATELIQPTLLAPTFHLVSNILILLCCFTDVHLPGQSVTINQNVGLLSSEFLKVDHVVPQQFNFSRQQWLNETLQTCKALPGH